jgi:hypothetical protein
MKLEECTYVGYNILKISEGGRALVEIIHPCMRVEK